MEAANRNLKIKLTQLQITREKTESVLASRIGNRIKRHRDALFAVVSAVDRSKRKVEELKIASGEELAAITAWNDKLDQDTAAVDIDMEKISTFLSVIEQEQVERVRKDQLNFEKEPPLISKQPPLISFKRDKNRGNFLRPIYVLINLN